MQPSALTAQERPEALAVLHSDRFADAAPAQVWATLLDENVYLASESTFYQMLRGVHGDVRERLSQATHPAKVKVARLDDTIEAEMRTLARVELLVWTTSPST